MRYRSYAVMRRSTSPGSSWAVGGVAGRRGPWPPATRPVAAVSLLATCLLVASCGRPGQHTATLEKTQGCLTKAGVRTGGRLDFVASTATGGAFKAHLRHNSVTIVFGKTESDANSINDAYHRFRSRNVGIDDVLHQQGNVVMLWRFHPSDSDLALVTGCF